MGVLTDIVVADRADAERVGQSACPSQEFAGIDAKGIDTVKLARLHSIASGAPYNHDLIVNGLLHEDSEDGPWVFLMPADLVEQLATLSEKELALVGDAWAATEEFGLAANVPGSYAQEILLEIAAQCRQAVAQQKSVLVWMCL